MLSELRRIIEINRIFIACSIHLGQVFYYKVLCYN